MKTFKQYIKELKCPPGIKKVPYAGVLGGKPTMVCPRRSASSAGGDEE